MLCIRVTKERVGVNFSYRPLPIHRSHPALNKHHSFSFKLPYNTFFIHTCKHSQPIKDQARSHIHLNREKNTHPKANKSTKLERMKKQGKQYKTLRIITKATNATADEVVSGQKQKHKGKKGKKPVSKSRDKAKGAYKLKSSDVVLNHRLESWTVATGEDVRWSKGFNGEGCDDDHEKDYGHGDVLHDSIVVQEVGGSIHGINDKERSIDEEKDFEGEGCDEDEDHEEQEYSHGDGLHESIIVQETKEKCTHGTDDDEEENMGFYEVGFIWEDVDDEGWCVVDEM